MRVVIAGGGYAGVMAAGRLAGRAGVTSVTLVDASGVQVQRTRLHQMMVGARPRQVHLARALEPLGVRVVRDRVQHIGVDRIELRDGGELPFDRLIVALGSQFHAPASMSGVHRLTDPEAARELGDAARAARVVTVIGAGLSGLEVATEVACMGASKVRLVTAGRVGADLCAGAERALRRRLSSLGIVLVEGARVESVQPGSVYRRLAAPVGCERLGGRNAGLADCEDLGPTRRWTGPFARGFTAAAPGVEHLRRGGLGLRRGPAVAANVLCCGPADGGARSSQCGARGQRPGACAPGAGFCPTIVGVGGIACVGAVHRCSGPGLDSMDCRSTCTLDEGGDPWLHDDRSRVGAAWDPTAVPLAAGGAPSGSAARRGWEAA